MEETNIEVSHDEVGKLKKEISTLTSGRAGAQRDLEEKEAEVAAAEKELAAAIDKLDTTQKQLEQCTARKHDAEDAAGIAESHLNQLNSSVTKAEKTIVKLQSETVEANDERLATIGMKTTEIEQITDKRNRAKADLIAATNELGRIKALTKSVNVSAQEALNVLDTKNERVLKTIDINQQDLAELEANVTLVETSLETLTATQSALVEKNQAINAELLAGKQAKQAAEAEITAVQAELAGLKAELADLVGAKLAFAKKREQLDSRESHIREHYKRADITYPEIT